MYERQANDLIALLRESVEISRQMLIAMRAIGEKMPIIRDEPVSVFPPGKPKDQ